MQNSGKSVPPGVVNEADGGKSFFQRGLVEIVEIPNHPFFIGCQFHPEFKSRPTIPHPLFNGLVKAALKNGKRGTGNGERVTGRGK